MDDAVHRSAREGMHRRTWPGALGRALRRCAQVLLPERCLLCGFAAAEPVCPSCDAQFLSDGKRRCAQCAMPLIGLGRADALGASGTPCTAVCSRCLADPPAFDAALTLADYAPPADALVLALKYGGRLGIAGAFARRLVPLLKAGLVREAGLPDVFIPVPLSAGRLVQRGYNQAWQIARPLARALRVPASAALVERTVDTGSQVRLSAGERGANLRGAFAVTAAGAALLADKRRHVAVVDDVLTSGATLDELAVCLKLAGASRVTCVLALRTP